MASVSLHCKVIPWLVALVKFNPTPHPTSAPVFILFSFFLNFYEFFFFVAFPFFVDVHGFIIFIFLLRVLSSYNNIRRTESKKAGPDRTGMIAYVCVGGGNRRELGVQPQLIIISSTGKDREKRKKGKGRRKKKWSSVEKERCIYYSIPSCWHRTIMF